MQDKGAFGLAGKTVVVTGAASGVGKSIVVPRSGFETTRPGADT